MIPSSIVYLLILGSLLLTSIGAAVLLILLLKDRAKGSIW